MQKGVMLCILLSVSVSAFGQRHKKKDADNQLAKDSLAKVTKPVSQDSLYLRMYHNGMKYGDYRTAITALNGLYAIHPDKIGYLDSLCLLYAQTENYAQCIFTGRDVLQALPDNVPVISALAVSEQQLGRYAEALELYEREYSKNSSLYAAYQIAVLDYALKKYGESLAALDRLIMIPQASKDKISFSSSSNSSQQVIYKAAAENLMGITYQDLKDYEKANEHFKKALAIQPDFVLAQNNLEALKKIMAGNPEKKTQGNK